MNNFFEKLKKYFNSVESKVNEYAAGGSNKVSNPSLSYVEWAMKLLNEGNEEIAIEKLETVTEMAMQNPNACVNLAITYIKRGELEKVKPLLKQALNIDSQCARAYLAYGIYYTAINDYKNAEHYYSIAAKLDPRLPEVFVNWAVSLVSQGKRQEAQEKFKKAMFYQPNNLIGLYLWAILDIDMGFLKQAKEKLSVVLSFQPKNADALYHMAVVYYKEKNYAASIDLTRSALVITKDNPLLYGLLADCYYSLGDYEKASETYQDMDRRHLYDEKTYIFWGENAYTQKDYETSIYAYKTVLRKNKDSQKAKIGLAKNYIETQEYDVAKDLLTEIYSENEENSEVLINLYKIEKNEKNYEKAIEYLNRAIKADVNNTKYYFKLGLLYEEAGDIKQAKDAYLKMIEYYTDSPEAYYHYAKLFIDDNPKEALRKIRTAYNSDKDNYDYAILYAKALIKNSQSKGALEIIENLNCDENCDIQYLKVEAMLNIKKYEPSITILYNLPQDKKDNEDFDYLLLKAYIIRANITKSQGDVNEMNDFSYYLSQKYSQNNKFMVKLKELEETLRNEV